MKLLQLPPVTHQHKSPHRTDDSSLDSSSAAAPLVSELSCNKSPYRCISGPSSPITCGFYQFLNLTITFEREGEIALVPVDRSQDEFINWGRMRIGNRRRRLRLPQGQSGWGSGSKRLNTMTWVIPMASNTPSYGCQRTRPNLYSCTGK